MTITDKKALLPLLNLNVTQNMDLIKSKRGQSGWTEPKVEELFWGTGNPFGHNFDIVLGSDLTYDLDILPILLSTMAALCEPAKEGEKGGEVILSYGRHRSVVPTFLEMAAEHFDITHVDKKHLPCTKELMALGAEFEFLRQISQPTRIVHMKYKQKQ